MVETDDAADPYAPSPYNLARSYGASDLLDFIESNEYKLTWEQGEPLAEIHEEIDVFPDHVSADDDTHEKVAKEGARGLTDWLDRFGHEVSYAHGEEIAQIRQVLAEGVHVEDDQ